ncbi:N-acetylmuramic acid 6-phosphate etherase [Companilactobacillus paralimentarius]|jgi:N-acetylmuramic acid 6-phosphate etherase|uniref:N-acetylmuramic acid 6-phosphate etherase n=1 Tax=Companilactobacillus paralimentarius TaxID=83526 RepID=UPI00384BA412
MNVTEMRNPNSENIDKYSTRKILKTINNADQEVPNVISNDKIIDQLALIVDKIVKSFQNDGHLFYIGAGTSGRLGVLDASECVPTFGVKSTMVQGIIAGGSKAITQPVEGAEDSLTQAPLDLQTHNVTKKDVVIGIAASGRTPYVISALQYAKKLGCVTASISCNPQSEVSKYSDYPIEAVVGPEILTGSTRMKSGTAQKLILNMISTTAMIRFGKTYSNLMVDLQPTNHKLIDRAIRIISEATNVSEDAAKTYYEKSDQQPKVAILMALCNIDKNTAEQQLSETKGRIADNIQ